jgi:hypothetical protein
MSMSSLRRNILPGEPMIEAVVGTIRLPDGARLPVETSMRYDRSPAPIFACMDREYWTEAQSEAERGL